MSKSPSKSETGRFGEEEASMYLQRKGYEILHRNWRSGKDELDIVARHDDALVFVEVKTRTGNTMGEPWESVDARKQEALARSAEAYIQHFMIQSEVQFDIVSVVISPEKDIWIDHIENAFTP